MLGQTRPMARGDVAVSVLLLEVERDLGDAVDRHRQRDEFDAVGEAA